MAVENKSNSNLFAALYPHIGEPFLVFDVNGKILSYNQEAFNYLNLQEEEADFYSFLDKKTGAELQKVIKNNLPIDEPVALEARINRSGRPEPGTKLILNSYEEGGESFIFCRIRRREREVAEPGKSSLFFSGDELSDIIENPGIIDVINEIKSLYPFTYIGKEKLQKVINALPELFWIEDGEGNYQLVNDKLAKCIGIEITQLDGESVGSFLPSHVVGIYESVISYIKKSLKLVVTEGVPLKGFTAGENYQTVQIPLSDVDGNVIAIIGITQNKPLRIKEIGTSELFSSGNKLINFIPKAICLIDSQGFIKQTTGEFRKLFETEFKDTSEAGYREVLPGEIAGKVDAFRDSGIDEENYSVEVNDKFIESFLGEINLYFNRVLDAQNEPAGISLLIEKSENISDLEKLISRRGKMFDLLIGNNPEPIFIYDTENLRFLEVNKAALDLYGYKKEEFLQMDLTDLYTPEDIQTLLDSSLQGVNVGDFTGPYRHKKKDGSSVFVELSRISFTFQDKEAHYNIVRNVTEKLELEKKSQSFKSIFNNTHDPVILTDPAGFITFVNDASADFFRQLKNDFIKSSFISYVDNEDRASVNNSIFKSDRIEEKTIDVKIKKSDGTSVRTKLSASPVTNFKGELESFTLVIQAREEKEVEVREVVKEVIVEKPVYKMVGDSGSSEVRNEPAFLSSLFHEILTPINVILGFVQDLTEGIENPTNEQKESVEIISQNRERLLNSMNSVIEYSNIENNNVEMNISDVAITEIIDYLQGNISDITGKKNVEFGYGRISSSLKFMTDKTKFQHFTTLLAKIATNASKDNKIYLSAYPGDDNNFVISIRDNYSYMSDTMLRIFKTIFTGVETDDSKDFGTSKLTLRLSNSLLKILRGKYEAIEGDKDKSDFVFVFPLDYSDAGEEATEKYEAAEVEDKTVEEPEENIISKEIEEEFKTEIEPEPEIIEEAGPEFGAGRHGGGKFELTALNCLYIEDQVDSQILFKVQMKELKETKFAVSFEEALPLLDNESFDFIVMDINLQGEYNGLDALKIIQKMPGYEHVPIIAVTAYVLPGDKEKFIAAGFNDFISKPIFREKMVESLERIFSMQI